MAGGKGNKKAGQKARLGENAARLFIGGLVHADGAAGRIVHLLERFVPFDGLGGRTGDGRAARHAFGGARQREQLLEDLAVQVAFFRGRRVVREAETRGFEKKRIDLR